MRKILGIVCLAALVALAVPMVASAQGTLFVKSNKVGIGTAPDASQASLLRVNGSATGGALVEAKDTNVVAAFRTMFQLTNFGPPSFTIQDAAPGGTAWFLGMGGVGGGNTLNLTSIGQTSGAPMVLALNGNMTIAGILAQGSSRTLKENITPVTPAEVLAKVTELPIASWNYTTDAYSTHIGPMAEDFYDAFGLGVSAEKITSIDTSGVAIAAIQGLHDLVQEKDAQIADLESRLAALERLLIDN